MTQPGAAAHHPWQFSRMGGFDQVRLDRAADVARLDSLDQKLWAALACPVKGLEMDERTLALIDTDSDGRIRVPEVLAAIAWCQSHLRDLAVLKSGSDAVGVTSISDATDSGKALLASVRQILRDLGKPEATTICLADVADTAALFAKTRLNGDGVVPAEAAQDEATRKAVEDVIACMGPIADRSGRPGVTQANVDAFFEQAAAFVAWTDAGGADAAVRPLGDGTAAAADAWRAVRAKVDDWFARCRVAAFDARALAAVNRKEDEYLALAAADLSVTAQEVAGFPLAAVAPGSALPLAGNVNPAWAAALAALRTAAVAPLLGDRESLTEAEWRSVGARLAPFEAWNAAKPAGKVEPLGATRLRELLASPAKAAISKLVADDLALAPAFEAIGQVERLVRYHRDLWRLLHNFVNFADFYSHDRLAVFQTGVLYLDGRACELVVRVDDAGRHAALAGLAKAYLAYCDCTRPGGEKRTIAAAFTGGDSDFLMVGRNGVFYDRQGRDWDATITKVIENPISVRQAFWAPYKKLVRLIEEQVAKRAAAGQAASDTMVAGAAETTAHAEKNAPPEKKKIDVGTVAALGVAVGAIATAIAAFAGYAASLGDQPFWKICVAFAVLLLIISGPSMLIAWLKLRQRNLAPILDANGWAVNGRVRLNVPFGGSLTSVAELPPGAIPAAADPFGERPSVWPRILRVVIGACFLWSLLNWYALVWYGLRLANVAEADIPRFVTSPADVAERDRRAAEPPAKAGEAAPEKK